MRTITPPAEQLSMKASILKTFEGFEKSVGAFDKPFLRRLRNTAIARFDELAFPSTKEEEWRFTPLQSLYRHQFNLASRTTDQILAEKQLPFPLADSIRVVFVDGF